MTETTSKIRDIGLLVLRIGLGGMYLYYGLPKLHGGPELWAKLGEAMATVGVTFAPVFWGFMAACAEGIGGFLLITGLLFRPACAFLAFTMLIAARMLLATGKGMIMAGHPIDMAIVFIALIFIGPGAYRIKKPAGCGCCCAKR